MQHRTIPVKGAETAGPDFGYTTAVNEYGFYCVPDAYARREVPRVLLSGGVYEPDTLRLMRRWVRDGDIITGGTFVGDFLPALSQVMASGATVHSFEPAPLSHAAAQITITLNRLDNVALHPVAVGAEPGTLHLQTVSDSGRPMAARARVVDSAIEGQTESVPVVPIDDLVDASRRVSILHLDLEGHEWPGILGAQRVIETRRPLIVLEADKPWAQRAYEAQLSEHFPGLGYRLVGLMERNAFYLPDPV
ncbi:FkbM family methyltransferase [Marinovum sp.]|uniref:FkbM family methyltransferase n=1 Tax=Marinovum sp. TaxID=2024839 RepID=UPI003A8CAD30